ncbi:hypothetical protein Tco_0146196 [Tanacetum coccineum]
MRASLVASSLANLFLSLFTFNLRGEEERKRLAEEEATNEALIRNYDDIKARIEADRLLAEKLQEEEREQFTIEERAKFLHDTIAAQRKFLITFQTYEFHSTFVLTLFSMFISVIPQISFRCYIVKMGVLQKRPRPQPDDDSDDEHRKCLRIVTFDSTLDSEIMETKSFVSKLHKVSSPDGDYLVVYRVNGHFRAFNYLIEGDLKIMMESLTEENDQGDFWNNQQEWEIFRWRLYEACEVCILELKDGIVIYMLVERMYPLSKELLQRMLDLGLEVEEESTTALHLVRFIKQQLNEE